MAQRFSAAISLAGSMSAMADFVNDRNPPLGSADFLPLLLKVNEPE
jgi:hypothetical protein